MVRDEGNEQLLQGSKEKTETRWFNSGKMKRVNKVEGMIGKGMWDQEELESRKKRIEKG